MKKPERLIVVPFAPNGKASFSSGWSWKQREYQTLRVQHCLDNEDVSSDHDKIIEALALIF